MSKAELFLQRPRDLPSQERKVGCERTGLKAVKGCEQGTMARRRHFRKDLVAGNAAGCPLSQCRLSVRSLEPRVVLVVKKE